MTNKELRKISDKLFKEDRDIENSLAYKSFYRKVILDAAISIGFIVFVFISIILMTP